MQEIIPDKMNLLCSNWRAREWDRCEQASKQFLNCI